MTQEVVDSGLVHLLSRTVDRRGDHGLDSTMIDDFNLKSLHKIFSTSMKRAQLKRTLLISILAAPVALLPARPAKALTAVCTANWTSSVTPTPNGLATASAALSGSCPSNGITAAVTVGYGLNAGVVNTNTNYCR